MNLLLLAVLCVPAGTGAADLDGWRQGFEAGVKAREAAHYRQAESLLTQALQEAEHTGGDEAPVALAANQLGLL